MARGTRDAVGNFDGRACAGGADELEADQGSDGVGRLPALLCQCSRCNQSDGEARCYAGGWIPDYQTAGDGSREHGGAANHTGFVLTSSGAATEPRLPHGDTSCCSKNCANQSSKPTWSS